MAQDYSQMYVSAGDSDPDMSDMTVYADIRTEFRPRGLTEDPVPVHANIIGSSHYIEVGDPDVEYYELTSCKPSDGAEHYDIPSGISESLIREIDGYRVEIHIDTVTAGEFDIEDWDLVYRFTGDGPEAPTAIDMYRYGWHTLHAYPEYGVDVVTETEFFPTD